MSALPGPKRSVSALCEANCPLWDLFRLVLHLSTYRPIVPFWDCAFPDCYFPFLTGANNAIVHENAVLKPASQAPG
jgi:hypothetical protein